MASRKLKARRAGSVLVAVVAVAATVVACTRLDLSSLAAAAPGWVAVAIALNSAAMLLRALAWLGMLRTALPSERVGAAVVVRATMIGVLGSALAPARAGEPLRVWLVGRSIGRRDRVATVVGTLVSQTLLNVFALALLAAIALPGQLAGHGRAATVITLGWILTLVLAVLVGARFAARSRLAPHLAALRAGLTVFRPIRRGLAISGAQLGAWGLQALAAYVLLLALHVRVSAPLATAAAILVAVNVTAAVPLAPSNVGIFQAACIGVLAAVGVSSGDALAYGLLLQAAEVATAVGLGMPALAGEFAPRRWAGGRAQPDQASPGGPRAVLDGRS